ncbi:MAG: hypothetical protein LBM00_06575 [Deltaproteobacteria bacterium]|jgi:hypothetical protein|nr:hypothetical protein [Deltaproteobacteria bacterium]
MIDVELVPRLLTGRLTRVTDINATIELKGRMGVLHLPLRAIITNKKLEVGDQVEVYLSYAQVIQNDNL